MLVSTVHVDASQTAKVDESVRGVLPDKCADDVEVTRGAFGSLVAQC